MSHVRRLRARLDAHGQSLVEFSIVLPVLLLIMLVAIDFGRIYLGWVNSQNMARLAANYAANNAVKLDAGDADTEDEYQALVSTNARATNCRLWDPATQTVLVTAPYPTFIDVDGNGTPTDIGDRVQVSFDCRFQVITPGISQILGSAINVTASSLFPIKEGMSAAGTSGGGGGGPVAPTAAFAASPLNQAVNVPISFTDESGGFPTSWQWDFGDPSSPDNTATTQDATHTYTAPGVYTVRLTVYNAAGSSFTTKTVGISIAAGPAFHADTTSGNSPLPVQFFDDSTGTPTAWLWEFGDGQTSTLQNPPHTYTSAVSRTYDVKLTVTNAAGSTFVTKTGYISIAPPVCPVPSLIGLRRNQVGGPWSINGFTTTVQDAPGAPNGNGWIVNSQDLTANTDVPCSSVIRVNGS
jgi:PKD repeat protein